MKALALQQPYAMLGVIGLKPWETRSKPTKFRGRHLITSSEGWKPEYKAATVELAKKYTDIDFLNLEFGKIIGSAEVTDCITTLQAIADMKQEVKDGKITQTQMDMYVAFGDFSPGRWAYKWERAIKFEVATPCKGALGFWDTRNQRGSYSINKMADDRLELTYLGRQLMTGGIESNMSTMVGNAIQGYMPEFIERGINDIEKRLFKL